MADIEKFVMESGRRAEKHVETNDAGDKVISVYAEEERPLKLEKRVVQKFKKVLAEEHVETIRDGEVVDRQVLSTEPKTNLELREHIALAPKSMLGTDNYVSKTEVAELVAQGVASGMKALSANQMQMQSMNRPVFTAQAAVEERVQAAVAPATGDNKWVTYGLIGFLVLNVVGMAWWLWHSGYFTQ